MLRRFRQHDLRQVTDLTGIWDFAFLGDADPDKVDLSGIDFDDRMAVPGCFDATPAYAGKRGLAAYRTRALVADRTAHRLILDGAHHWCRVFVDGRKVRDHVGGFTRFACDFNPRRAGQVKIVVLVDNRFDYKRVPTHMEYFDWFHFGGLARSAELHRLGELWIDDLRVRTVDYRARRIAVEVHYRAAAPPGRTRLRVQSAHAASTRTVNLKDAAGEVALELELAGADLWSPQSPALHDLHVVLGGDDWRERVGIRQVAVKGRDILINGRCQRLVGFCRHESHPQFGHGLPDALLVADVQQLRDMGCNFVRGSHYPQDLRFLDLCDEAGICVWCESIGWQQTAEHLNDPRFIDAQLANVDEMIAGAYNRPSVILWGALNEGHSEDAQCRRGYEKLLQRIRQLDSTRPATYATCRPTVDICYDLADVISVNTYPGWYGGEIEEIPEQLDKIVAHLDSVGHGGKPLIISEIGAGAIPGWRDWNQARWSEQYQARLLETVIRHMFIDRGRFAGLSIWQFGDIRTGERAKPGVGRPRCFNNKGVVDEYRRPKLAYETVRTMFRQLQKLKAP